MSFFQTTVEDRVAIVTYSRPPANALSQAVLTSLNELLTELEENKEVRVIVLKGEGRFFSAGADIKEFTTVTTEDGFAELGKGGQDVFERMETLSKPIIAAIHGAALGGGLELAMGCHLRLVTPNAKLGLPELQLGLVPGFAGTQRLPRLIGSAKAAELLFTSEPLTGEEAVQWGLANRVVEEEKLFDEAIVLAKKIAEKSPVALKETISLLNYSKSKNFYEGVKKEQAAFGRVFTSKDGQEGIAAFLQKRKPTFTGE